MSLPTIKIRWNIIGLFAMAYAAAFIVSDEALEGDLVLMITTAAIGMAREIFQSDESPPPSPGVE